MKDGKDSTSTNRDDWNIKQYSDSLIFTNDGTSLGEDAIIITNDAVIRLVYDPTFGDYTNDVNFYDYDITEDGDAHIRKMGVQKELTIHLTMETGRN